MCSATELNSGWADKPPQDLLPGYYQVAHVKNRNTWVINIRQNSRYLWVPLPGGGARNENEFHTLPWLWGPRIELIEVPAKPFEDHSQVSE